MLNKIDELVKAISDMPEVKRFRELEKGINESKEYKDLIDNLKSVQKKMVNYSYNKDLAAYNRSKEEYDALMSKLNDMPFTAEYFDLIEYLNDLLKQIETVFNEGLKS